MDIEITEQEHGCLIEISTQKKAALAAYFNGEERIYLPEKASSDTTYYIEETDALTSTENGYVLKTDQRPEKIQLIN
ncbi:hypothetical protein ACK3SF_05135 [Candidatus Nanosalina sp. VS9-1]|uniref:hypothetical protein n=1 Tax=Candidatus Nanosalina sp. VS9-1 TaxID=3388566 RepID=UPI0039DF4204